MSHNILTHDHMVSANNVTPWHKLGTVVPGSLTPTEAFIAAKLDWLVEKHPIVTRVREELKLADAIADLGLIALTNPEVTLAEALAEINYDLPVTGKFATVRQDISLPLGVVGDVYTSFQNHEGRELVEVLLDGGEIEIETAGSLNNGATVWVLVKLHRDLMVNGDQHIAYLLFTWSHDGTSSIRVLPTPVRVVCANTLGWALHGARTQWTAHHTTNVSRRIQQARETLGLAWKYYDEFETEARQLMDLRVSDPKFDEVLTAVVPDPTPDADGKVSDRKATNVANRRALVRRTYTRSPIVGEFHGTGWGVVQAFNSVDLWGGRVHGGEAMRAERQANRILAGDTRANTERVRQLLLVGAN